MTPKFRAGRRRGDCQGTPALDASGGTAPIKMSRAIPPATAVTKASTRTPNTSRRRSTLTMAPLSAKTIAPTQLRLSIRRLLRPL